MPVEIRWPRWKRPTPGLSLESLEYGLHTMATAARANGFAGKIVSCSHPMTPLCVSTSLLLLQQLYLSGSCENFGRAAVCVVESSILDEAVVAVRPLLQRRNPVGTASLRTLQLLAVELRAPGSGLQVSPAGRFCYLSRTDARTSYNAPLAPLRVFRTLCLVPDDACHAITGLLCSSVSHVQTNSHWCLLQEITRAKKCIE